VAPQRAVNWERRTSCREKRRDEMCTRSVVNVPVEASGWGKPVEGRGLLELCIYLGI